jgi:hypothetical protein
MEAKGKSRGRRWLVLLPPAFLLLTTIACRISSPTARVGELRNRSETVERGDAETVRVEINMAAGELEVSGGAAELLEADFTYNVDELEPQVEYSGGRLVVDTPEDSIRVGSWWDLDDYRYEWDLRFSDNVPMEMMVEVAAGTADLELGNLSLTELEIQTGASEVRIDLSDSPTLRRLNVETGVGQARIDLSGDWQADLDAVISAGVGELSLRLPRSVCVRVEAEGGLSDVDTSGLTNDGGAYVNSACGVSDVTMRIDISAGVGAINLEVEP